QTTEFTAKRWGGIAAGSSKLVLLELRRDGATALPRKRVTIVTDLALGSAGSGRMQHVATATAEVTGQTPESLPSLGTVELQTSLESLNEERGGTVYLVVSNTSTSLLTVEAVAVDKPSFVTIPIPMDIATEAIPPGHQRAIPLSVTANDTVTPG